MSYNLFLDDLRVPQQGFNILKKTEYLQLEWVVVRSHDEFVEYITKNGLPDLVSFDHDLADEHYAPVEHWDDYDGWAATQGFKEKTGYESALWLVDYCIDNKLPLPKWLAHTQNITGRIKINALFQNYIKFVEKYGQENN